MDADSLLIKKHFHYLGPELLEEILKYGIIKDIPEDTGILEEGQYVKVIPVVLEGLIKVYSRYEDKELLLYYIEPFESCIMSFAASLKNEPSRIFATTEEDTHALLLPSSKVTEWVRQYNGINTLFYQQYNMRYAELLDTINYLLYHKLDKRIMDYLLEKSRLKGENIINIRHKQIASELGTAREVITRVLIKMEKEGKVRQHPNGIEILQAGDQYHQ
jgi:CRP/FNR family transcriptional regulator, anaerobic regulatory protein